MADIDKALPNEVRKEFEVPGEEEIKELALEEVEQEEGSPEPVDIQENEDLQRPIIKVDRYCGIVMYLSISSTILLTGIVFCVFLF